MEYAAELYYNIGKLKIIDKIIINKNNLFARILYVKIIATTL